jgi:phospholipase C
MAAFKHIVVIVQENRTPDNLFQGLCAPPYGSAQSCSTSPNTSQYDIQTSNWLNKSSSTGVTQPGAVALANQYDLQHTQFAFKAMCDKSASGVCLMDGAANVNCSGTCVPSPQFQFVDNSTGILNPYLELATQYGWANYMFETNQGPSFPAHQYLFGATSAPSAGDDAAGIFAEDNTGPNLSFAGCASATNVTAVLVEPNGVSGSIYPCFDHQTLPDLLPSNLTWRYYTSGNGIWIAPNTIQHICQSTGPGGTCTGQEWTNNMDFNPADVLTDITNCNLRSVSWVIPTGQNSDHAGSNTGGGPSWVASIVNAIGNSSSCDGGTGYWNNTAILITWDDWGGWYDHEPPTILGSVQGDFEQGFRVPLLVVSAYTPLGYIGNNRIDFGSMLQFIEKNFGIAPGALNFADARANYGLDDFFNLTMSPRSHTTVQAPLSAQFFINDKRAPLPPDDD